MALTLRPRQVQAIADIQAAYRGGAIAPLLVAPTAFGKTATSVEMIKLAVAKGKRVWFMAHLKEILNDTAARLRSEGIRFGYIWADHLTDRRQLVQIVSVQTAAARLDRLVGKPDLIIIDEAHLAIAAMYQKVFEWAGAGPKYYPLTSGHHAHLLHLTATPKRLSGEPMGDVADRLVLTCSTQTMIDEGFAPPVRYLTPDMPDMGGVASVAGDYDLRGSAAVMTKPKIVGNVIETYRTFGLGRPALGFCVNNAAAETMAQEFRQAGFRAMAVSGESENDEREEAQTKLMNGEVDWVFNCKLWVAGVDVPVISYMADLKPTQSLTDYLQRIGRGLRLHASKEYLLYSDHAGNLARHGNPLAAREWSLAGEEKQKGKRNEISTKRCPKCQAVVNSIATDCVCGHVFEVVARTIEHVDGDMREVDLSEINHKAREAARMEKKPLTGAQRMRSIEERTAILRAKGVKRPEMVARAQYMNAVRAQQQASKQLSIN